MKKLLFLISFLLLLQVEAQKTIAIYWDVSYSMKDRSLEKEIQFLNNYFKKNTSLTADLVMFSNDIILSERFNIENSDWSSLENELRNSIYDGSTAYSALFTEVYDEYLLFTDGIENKDKLKPPTDKPIYIISSLPNSNSVDLKLIADLSSGAYVLLGDQMINSKVNQRVEQVTTTKNNGFVNGVVTGDEGKLSNVSIINRTKNAGVASGSDGTYRIEAEINDILVFTYLGKKSVTIRVADVETINIRMQNLGESLDEIVVTSNVEKEEELVNTGNMMVDKKRLGYSIESIDEEDISSIDTNVKQAVKGQFSNLAIQNSTTADRVDLSQFIGRGKNMTINGNQYGLIVVDGVPLEPSDSSTGNREVPYFDVTKKRVSSTDHLDPNLIVNITYLKGLAATNKYGSMGRNGVLLITTKNGIADKAISGKAIELGTTQVYKGDAEMISELPNNSYINDLKSSTSVEDAFDKYLTHRETFGDDPIFYLDVFDYFKGWQNPIISKRILSNIYEIGYNNALALRNLSYKQHSTGDFEGAVKALERVLTLLPEQSQSYRDLALAYCYSGDYKKALKLYDRIDKGIGVKANMTGLSRTIMNDFKNLIAHQKNNLNLINVNQKFMKPVKYKSRIVFEWSDLNSEFDLNIINPQKRYFTWSHTNAENSQRISQQKEFGYGLEEFYLTDQDIGEWTFNMKYYGKTSADTLPVFVKMTIYRNFGSPNETKEIKVIRLHEQDVEQTVLKVEVN